MSDKIRVAITTKEGEQVNLDADGVIVLAFEQLGTKGTRFSCHQATYGTLSGMQLGEQICKLIGDDQEDDPVAELWRRAISAVIASVLTKKRFFKGIDEAEAFAMDAIDEAEEGEA